MALWKPLRGNRTALDTIEKHDGWIYFCTDDGSLFFDYIDADGNLQRKQINAEEAEKISGLSLDELKTIISTQDAVVLHEAQSYTDAAIAQVKAEGQGGASIIDVISLPTDNIDTNATYRMLNGTFVLSKIMLYDSTCIIKEDTSFLNESGLPLVEKHDDVFAYTGYYCVSDNTAYGYIGKQKIKDALDYSNLSFTEKMAIEAALLSVKEGWNTMSEIAQSLLSASINLKWGGVVTTIEGMSDSDSLYIYLFEELFSYKNNNWVSLSSQVGRPGTVAGAEIFNDFSNVASGILSHAEGNKTFALGAYSHSEGKETIAEGYTSHAEGGFTSALNEYAHAEGYMTKASGDRSHAEGANSLASGNIAHAEGSETKATASTAHAEGYKSEASGSSSHAEGSETNAIGSASHAEGSLTTASETGAHAEGGSTTAEAVWSHAEGYGTTTSGNSSHAEGQNTISSGTASHAEGIQTQASANYSHAEGAFTNASGQSTHAEGENTKATANAAHAEGYNTEASNVYAHAEGALTVASATGAHAEGGSTKATEAWSHAEGYGTNASGNSSHAEGLNTVASGAYSHASGMYTTASGEAQTVIGQYNIQDDAAAFIIGNGYPTLTGYIGRNAMTVDWNGNAEFAGNITSNGSPVLTANQMDRICTKGPGITSDYEQTVVGRYNEENPTKAFIVGNGYLNGKWLTRSNAMTVDWDGNIWFAGSMASGPDSVASGEYSHAEGALTIASSKCQHVQGVANIEDTEDKYLHIVGNGGESDESEEGFTRSNAHTLDWSGNAWFQGDVKVGGTGYDNENAKTLATQEFVKSYIEETLLNGAW